MKFIRRIISQIWGIIFHLAWIYFYIFFFTSPLQYSSTATGLDASKLFKINLMNNAGLKKIIKSI